MPAVIIPTVPTPRVLMLRTWNATRRWYLGVLVRSAERDLVHMAAEAVHAQATLAGLPVREQACRDWISERRVEIARLHGSAP